MEHQVAIHSYLIMVALVLGIGNTYYIAKYLIRNKSLKESEKSKENADKSKDIKD
jgi:preprotein translocase subunit SecF